MMWLPFGDRLYNMICPNMAGNSHYVSKCMGSEDEEMYSRLPNNTYLLGQPGRYGL